VASKRRRPAAYRLAGAGSWSRESRRRGWSAGPRREQSVLRRVLGPHLDQVPRARAGRL